MESSRYESWWREDQEELAADRTKTWTLTAFRPTPGLWLPTEGGRLLGRYEEGMEVPEGTIVELRAWDHEHCQLCFEKISDVGDAVREGYRSDDGKWICITCYRKYIAPDERKS